MVVASIQRIIVTLARHSDVRLTLNIYTRVGMHDQVTAIAALLAPPLQMNDHVGEKVQNVAG